MTYERRRKAASAGAALGTGLVTAAGAFALGGEVPTIKQGGQGGAQRAAVAPVVVEKVEVRRVTAAAPASAAGAAPALPATRTAASAAPAMSGTPASAPAAPRSGKETKQRRRRSSAPRRKRKGAKAPAASTPAAAISSGGYRSFASATAAVISGPGAGLTIARAASGSALDGRAPDTSDELGSVVSDLPAGRTAFGRAVALEAGGRSDAVAASSSPPAAPAADQAEGGSSMPASLPFSLGAMQSASAANTDANGSCVRGVPVSSADARGVASREEPAGTAPTLTETARGRTETLLEKAGTGGTRHALVTFAEVFPPDVSLAGVRIRFLGPVILAVRAAGTPGSASAELGPDGTDTSAPLLEVTSAGMTNRYTAGQVLGGARTLKLGPASISFGGAPHARGNADAPAQVADDGTAAAAAADVLSVQAGGARVTIGHVEASVAVPPGGISC